MKIVIADFIEAYKIVEYKDVVFASAKSSEGSDYREKALSRIKKAAELIGANAVVNFRMKLYVLNQNELEVTLYGNAVIADPVENRLISDNKAKVNLESYIYKPKETSPLGKLNKVGDYKFVACPSCGAKYKFDTDEHGNPYIKGFEDIDPKELGTQIKCIKCGTKFTIPNN